MEHPPSLPDDAPMSDVTSPSSPLVVDPDDPVTVGAPPDEAPAPAPVPPDDPGVVGAPSGPDAAGRAGAPPGAEPGRF